MMAYTGDVRPCLVRGEAALFHGWAEIEKPIMDDGKVIGNLKVVNGVVEAGTGHVRCVKPSDIQFLDSREKFADFDWSDGQ